MPNNYPQSDKNLRLGGPSQVWTRTRSLLGIIGLLAGIFLLVRVIETTGFSGAPEILLRLGPWAVVLILIPYSLAALIDTGAWRSILIMGGKKVTQGLHLTYSKMFRIRTATEAVVITLPLGSILSDPFKAWMLKSEFGLPVSKSAGSIVLRKTMLGFSQSILTLAIASLAIIFPTTFFLASLAGAKVWTLLIISAIIVSFYSLLTALFRYSAVVDKFHRWLGKIPLPRIRAWYESKEEQFHEFNNDLGALRGMKPLLKTTGMYMLIWSFENIETFVILALLGSNLSAPQALLMEVACVLLRTSAPIVPGGIGVQDTGYVSILMAAGNSGSLAVAFLMIKRSREALWASLGYVLIAISRKKLMQYKDPSLRHDSKTVSTQFPEEEFRSQEERSSVIAASPNE